MLEAVTQAAQEGTDRTSPKKLLERLKSAGRLDALKEDLAQRKALDVVTESAKPISIEQAQARDRLWTPDDVRACPDRLIRPALDPELLAASAVGAATGDC